MSKKAAKQAPKRKSRTLALASPEPRKRGPVQKKSATKSMQIEASIEASTPDRLDFFPLVMTWSPIGFLLRQQAAIARAMATAVPVSTSGRSGALR